MGRFCALVTMVLKASPLISSGSALVHQLSYVMGHGILTVKGYETFKVISSVIFHD